MEEGCPCGADQLKCPAPEVCHRMVEILIKFWSHFAHAHEVYTLFLKSQFPEYLPPGLRRLPADMHADQ
jgi:hypothetical protein